MKNILVIGSTGQIGSELTKKLRSIYGNVMLWLATSRVLSLLANWLRLVLWPSVMSQIRK